MKHGVITDGIDYEDLERAFQVMKETNMEYAELQFFWGKEIGDHSDEEYNKVKELLVKYNLKLSCLSRHIFGGISVKDTKVGDATYQKHFDALKRNIKIAKDLNCPMVRIMSGRKEMIIFGGYGAEKWVVSGGAWDSFIELMKPVAKLAEEEDILIGVETGNNAKITSGWLGKKMIDDLKTDHIKIIWDIPNTMYCTDIPYPDAYEEIKDYIGHIHLKDCVANISRATVNFCPLGTGDVAPYLEPIAKALKRDDYQGVVSLESVYHPLNGSYEDGYRECLPKFKELFE